MVKVRTKNVTIRSEVAVMVFEYRWKCQEARSVGASRSLKRQRNKSFLKIPEGMKPC